MARNKTYQRQKTLIQIRLLILLRLDIQGFINGSP
jgi:hypothetical protein